MPYQLFVGTESESEVDYCNNVKAGVMRCKMTYIYEAFDWNLVRFQKCICFNLAKTVLFYFTREDRSLRSAFLAASKKKT